MPRKGCKTKAESMEKGREKRKTEFIAGVPDLRKKVLAGTKKPTIGNSEYHDYSKYIFQAFQALGGVEGMMEYPEIFYSVILPMERRIQAAEKLLKMRLEAKRELQVNVNISADSILQAVRARAVEIPALADGNTVDAAFTDRTGETSS